MAHLGLVGIGVMGSAFALNLAENGHDVSMLDRTKDKMSAVAHEATTAGLRGALSGFLDPKEFLSSLLTPKTVLILVPAGGPLDAVIASLKPHLSRGDILADLGNSNWEETERRGADLDPFGIRFLGMGISGGADGARHGPSIMAGGSPDSWSALEGPLKDAAATFEGEPCCAWFGPGGSGHFIKMLHNGIEYADMQLIAEAYGLMRDGLGMDAAATGDVFEGWMNGPLNSYLIEIAAEVCRASDPKTGNAMLDMIHDAAGQKGTGRWSVIEALHLGAATSMMVAAVEARNISADWDARQAFEERFGSGAGKLSDDRSVFLKRLETAMLAAKVGAYTQGFNVLARASDTFGWGLDLAAIARVWRAGCIIRSVMLDEISDAFEANPGGDLAQAPIFAERLASGATSLRETVVAGISANHAMPSFGAALNYYNLRRTGRGTANMIQGLRDRFGAHSFERIDDRGVFSNGPWHRSD
ncbi:MAG: NADP-dependent phosphogluconate dehydrogenase [Pseudomonadota bacterium]